MGNMKMSPSSRNKKHQTGGAPTQKEVTFIREDVKGYGEVEGVTDGKIANNEGAAALHMSMRHFQRIKDKIRQTDRDPGAESQEGSRWQA
jgi:hypothetical protein